VRVLAVDIGRGTSDILFWDDSIEGENQTHLVVPSATRVVAEEIGQATRVGLPVLFEGPLMGGGPSTEAMKRHVGEGYAFYATPAAARTFDDDLSVAQSMGVTVISPADAQDVGPAGEGSPGSGQRGPGGVFAVRSGDLRLDDLLQALSLLGELRPLDGIAVAVQDHGQAPPGMSDREFRFQKLAENLSRGDRRLSALFYPRTGIPRYLTRLQAVADSVDENVPLVVGDTGAAAVWGAALAAGGAALIGRADRCLAINFGNGHTLMAVVEDGTTIDGVFEHHTAALEATAMVDYMRRFATGSLEGRAVFEDGGHGALPVSQPFRLDEMPLVVTGPQRGRFTPGLAEAGIAYRDAAIHGDMMLTGAWGLLQGYLAKHG
jgi:uncharacterized protein (DUF1786 family)